MVSISRKQQRPWRGYLPITRKHANWWVTPPLLPSAIEVGFMLLQWNPSKLNSLYTGICPLSNMACGPQSTFSILNNPVSQEFHLNQELCLVLIGCSLDFIFKWELTPFKLIWLPTCYMYISFPICYCPFRAA